jgi:hypothetical protein
LLLSAFLVGCGGGGGGPRPSSPSDADRDGIADAQDCAPTDSTTWQRLSFQSLDSDADGHRANSAGELCVGGSLPSTHFASPVAASDVDCDDSDTSRWQNRPYSSRDVDADGFSIAAAGQVCSGASLPAGYGPTAPLAVAADCDDANAVAWRVMTTYGDADADGVGAGAGEVMCMGANPPANRSLLGYDPSDDPSDPDAGAIASVDLPSWLLTTP